MINNDKSSGDRDISTDTSFERDTVTSNVPTCSKPNNSTDTSFERDTVTSNDSTNSKSNDNFEIKHDDTKDQNI